MPFDQKYPRVFAALLRYGYPRYPAFRILIAAKCHDRYAMRIVHAVRSL